jgi:phosphopantothenoylcysteine decarboxylase/phosphopantothenate--cysteine ligase
MLKGKTIVLGVTGSIAAYKIATLASLLVKAHADVHVIMTQNATNFITAITFETLTGNKCLIDTFDRNFQFHVSHVSLAQRAHLVLLAPASANSIGKLANGIADDMLSTTIMATKAPVLIAPAMNTHMFENPIVQDNLDKLARFGYTLIEPATGRLACDAIGKGKMPEPELLFEHILKEIAKEKDLKGKNVLVTAGPTKEAIDPVRFITNHSTGTMGYALAKQAMLRGANVTLISGEVALPKLPFVNTVQVTSAEQMLQAVLTHLDAQDIIIKCAAVADYTPAHTSLEKIKKSEAQLSLSLTKTTDILKEIGKKKKPHQFLCGFSMETSNMLENATKKMIEKKLDMIVANNLKVPGAGFGTQTNQVTLVTPTETIELPLLTKEETAQEILQAIIERSS